MKQKKFTRMPPINRLSGALHVAMLTKDSKVVYLVGEKHVPDLECQVCHKKGACLTIEQFIDKLAEMSLSVVDIYSEHVYHQDLNKVWKGTSGAPMSRYSDLNAHCFRRATPGCVGKNRRNHYIDVRTPRTAENPIIGPRSPDEQDAAEDAMRRVLGTLFKAHYPDSVKQVKRLSKRNTAVRALQLPPYLARISKQLDALPRKTRKRLQEFFTNEADNDAEDMLFANVVWMDMYGLARMLREWNPPSKVSLLWGGAHHTRFYQKALQHLGYKLHWVEDHHHADDMCMDVSDHKFLVA